MAMCQAAKEAAWLTGPLKDFGLDPWSPLVIIGDNQSPLTLTQSPVFHPRSKHIASTVKCISTKAMVDDALTKSLPPLD